MKRMRAFMCALCTFALAGTLTARARAASPAVRAQLQREVERARAADPQAFAKLSRLVAEAPMAHARARSRRAPMGLVVASLGPRALLPALEKIALADRTLPPSDEERTIRRDLIEATGLLRDARAVPVLVDVLEDPTEDDETLRTTTEALARIGGDAAAKKLLAELATARDGRALSLVAGMGELRRREIADALVQKLEAAQAAQASQNDETVRTVARSLGRMGNAWAWRLEADRSDEASIRALVARALVRAFTKATGETRESVERALLVVSAPETPALVTEARRTASPELARALDALAAHYARSPLGR